MENLKRFLILAVNEYSQIVEQLMQIIAEVQGQSPSFTRQILESYFKLVVETNDISGRCTISAIVYSCIRGSDNGGTVMFNYHFNILSSVVLKRWGYRGYSPIILYQNEKF